MQTITITILLCGRWFLWSFATYLYKLCETGLASDRGPQYQEVAVDGNLDPKHSHP